MDAHPSLRPLVAVLAALMAVSNAAHRLAVARSASTAWCGRYVYTRREGDTPHWYTQWARAGDAETDGWTVRRTKVLPARVTIHRPEWLCRIPRASNWMGA